MTTFLQDVPDGFSAGCKAAGSLPVDFTVKLFQHSIRACLRRRAPPTLSEYEGKLAALGVKSSVNDIQSAINFLAFVSRAAIVSSPMPSVRDFGKRILKLHPDFPMDLLEELATLWDSEREALSQTLNESCDVLASASVGAPLLGASYRVSLTPGGVGRGRSHEASAGAAPGSAPPVPAGLVVTVNLSVRGPDGELRNVPVEMRLAQFQVRLPHASPPAPLQ